jgi:ankyrin repeat protein
MDLIHAAAQWGLQPMVARLAQEEPALVNAANEYGWTCLMLACSRGHVGLATWLLDHGARIDQGDLDGFTALTHAACGRRGRREAVALLLARGADPNAVGRWGSTALMEAASLGLAGRVRALLEGAPREGPRALRLDARDVKGSTALFKVRALRVGMGVCVGVCGGLVVPSVFFGGGEAIADLRRGPFVSRPIDRPTG